MPPNGQGLTALVALNILEGIDLKAMGHNSSQYIHHVAESLRLAFADSLVHCADPACVEVPVKELLQKDYAKKRRDLMSTDKVIPPDDLHSSGLDLPVNCDTVYFCTSDRWGNTCSFINSNFMGFGTAIVPEGCGFTLQNRGFGFSLNPNHKNVMAPNKRPYHTIIPSMVTSAETNDHMMTFGVMGGYMQPQGHVQVLLNIAEFGLDPQTALDMPRFSLGETGAGSMYSPHSIFNGVMLEAGIPANTQRDLAALGHKVSLVEGHERATFGRGQVITSGSWWRSRSNERSQSNERSKSDERLSKDNRKTSVYWAGSDPRADGQVAGY